MIRNATMYESVRVTDGLYYYVWGGRGNNCNACLFPNVLRGDRPHAVIDPGAWIDDAGEDCLEFFAAAIGKDGFRIDQIGLVLNTHYHSDHCALAEPLMARYGTDSALSREDDECAAGVSEAVFRSFGVAKPWFAPTFHLKEGAFDLGDNGYGPSLEVILSPGHSPGSVCFYWPVRKVLISGDVVFPGSFGRTDYPGGDARAMRESIERLSRLDIEALLPGHSTGGAACCSAPGRWPAISSPSSCLCRPSHGYGRENS